VPCISILQLQQFTPCSLLHCTCVYLPTCTWLHYTLPLKILLHWSSLLSNLKYCAFNTKLTKLNFLISMCKTTRTTYYVSVQNPPVMKTFTTVRFEKIIWHLVLDTYSDDHLTTKLTYCLPYLPLITVFFLLSNYPLRASFLTLMHKLLQLKDRYYITIP